MIQIRPVPNQYFMTVESSGSMPPLRIVELGLQNLTSKFEQVLQSLDHATDD
jgi:hypothetical protein